VSEVFTVWHGQRLSGSTLSFYVTAINVQELGTGSRDFVEGLCEDLGLLSMSVEGWTIGTPFAVDFLSSEPTSEWRDTWLLTWVLELVTSGTPELPTSPVDTYAADTSWDGCEATPTAFEVVAVGTGPEPDIGHFDEVSTARCTLGHLHIRVHVRNDNVDAAAEAAGRVKALCETHGWITGWRDGQDA
jgi:hypothetical protein